jgi:hypothetical protein
MPKLLNEASVKKVLAELPTEQKSVLLESFTEMSPEQIKELVDENMKDKTVRKVLFEDADAFLRPLIDELDKYKSELGGSPVFGSKTPTINEDDMGQFFFNIPMVAVKDWLRNALNKEWQPKPFWCFLGRLFNVTQENKKSQYEEAYIRITQFGLLVVNKTKFFKILDQKDSEHYSDLGKLTGLAWHPTINAISVEKAYIEFVQQFLTVHFSEAKQRGKQALLDYFQAFDGVCFEDRTRHLEEYIKKPIDTIVLDYDTGQSVENAYEKELMVYGAQMREKQALVTPSGFLDHLEKKGVFDMEFATAGGKAKPDRAGYCEWAQSQVDMAIMDEEPTPSFPKQK